MPSNREIICTECHRSELLRKRELHEAQFEENLDEDIIQEEPAKIARFNGWQEYAWHILEVHPVSDRINWALKVLELPSDTPLPVESRNIKKVVPPKPKKEIKAEYKVAPVKSVAKRSFIKRLLNLA